MTFPESDQHLDFQDHLKTLHEMTLELSQIESLDDLYRRAIEYGFYRLGFDRLGIFLLNPSDESWTGTYGIDLEGKIRDEHDHQEGFSVLVKLMWHDLIAKRNQVMLRDGVVLYDSGDEVGIGWHATAGLWQDNDIFGLLFVDNAISQRPQRSYEHELISLFSSTVAHLISRKSIEHELRNSQQQYHELFENVPVALLVEDYSAVKRYIDQLKMDGITDFDAYFDTHSDAVVDCATSIKIIDTNQAALDLYRVTAKHQLPEVLAKLFTSDRSTEFFREQLVTLAEGNLTFDFVTNGRVRDGKAADLYLKLRIAPDAEATWSRVYVAITEIRR